MKVEQRLDQLEKRNKRLPIALTDGRDDLRGGDDGGDG